MEEMNCSVEVDSAIKKILSEEHINNYDIKILSDPLTGLVGFTSKMTSVEVTGKKRRQKVILNLIIKTLLSDETQREKCGLIEMFKLELHMYDKVLPAYEKLLLENDLDPLVIYPRFYHTFANTIIMENLKCSGFRHSEEVILDNDHLELAILECSRFHALGFALRKKQKRKFEKIAPRNNLFFQIYPKHFKTNVYNLCRKSLSVLDSSTDMEAIDVFGSCVADLDFFFKSLTSQLDDKYATIIHGELKWTNMMFKYDDLDQPLKPTQLRFFDFQVAAVAPPVIDLITLLYTNFQAKEYENLDQYLNLYYQNLSNHLKNLNCDCSKLYPFEVLTTQWKAFAKFGLIINQDMAQLESFKKSNLIEDMKADEGPKDADSDYEFSHLCMPKGNIEIYKEIVKPLILHLVQKKFI